MKTLKNIAFYCLLAVCVSALVGCGKKADENKPLSEVKAEAEQMSAEKLRSMALAYKDAITAKQKEIEKYTGKLNEIPIAQKMGAEAKETMAELEDLLKSASALKERFEVYYNKLNEKGGDLSGLEI